MKKYILAGAALAALAASAAHATITYSGSVTGTSYIDGTVSTASYTITTDGTLGTLSLPNFTGYTLSINGFDSSGTGVWSNNDGFGAVSATATTLSFNFGSTASQLIFFDGNSYLCISSDAASCAGEPSPSVGFGVFDPSLVGSFDPRPASVQVIATAAAVTEPASWAMLIAGFGLTGAAMRRRKVAVA
jgi:hypothetical protein